MNEKSKSGQMLIVAALAISLLIVSTTAYVYEVGKPFSATSTDSLKDFILSIEIGSRHVVIGALANISRGGNQQVLVRNLERWISIIKTQYQFGEAFLNYTTVNDAPYSSGVWVFWDVDGFGVTSASVSFNFRLNSKEVEVQLPFKVNITTTMQIQGFFKSIEGNQKEVNITCNVFNDGNPSLAKNFTVYCNNLDGWHRISEFSVFDFGNGTYTIFFTTPSSSSPLEVSVLANDMRNIWVQANATCTQL